MTRPVVLAIAGLQRRLFWNRSPAELLSRIDEKRRNFDMKRFLVSLVLFCSMVGLGWAAVPGGTNFSGTWALDKAKSESLPRMMENVESLTWVVTQNDKQLSLETKAMAGGSENAQKYAYNLDGSETTADVGGRMPGKATLKAKWMGDGKILELSSVRNLNIQGNDVTITTTEHWELADGGNTLKVHRTMETPRGTQESKLVFTKK
jgi:hypothetical protein